MYGNYGKLPKKGKDPKEDLVTKAHTCFQRKNDLQ